MVIAAASGSHQNQSTEGPVALLQTKLWIKHGIDHSNHAILVGIILFISQDCDSKISMCNAVL